VENSAAVRLHCGRQERGGPAEIRTPDLCTRQYSGLMARIYFQQVGWDEETQKELILRLSSSDMQLYARKIRGSRAYAVTYLQIQRARIARNKVGIPRVLGTQIAFNVKAQPNPFREHARAGAFKVHSCAHAKMTESNSAARARRTRLRCLN
jgi:hypothetical protein